MFHHRFSLRSTWPGARAALVGAGVIAASAAGAQSDLPYGAPLPIPRPALPAEPSGEDEKPGGETSIGDTDTLLFQPDLSALAGRIATSNIHAQARAPIPLDIIRKGFSARSGMIGTSPERSVGFRLGADIFSVSTRLVAPPGQEQGRDARIDWRLARPIANAGPGFIWTISTGGGSGILGHPEQNASLLVGYRHRLFEHLTLTSQVSMVGNYIFAPGDGPHSSLLPELKLTANLAALADLPWETSLDLALTRQMPLVSSDFETKGTAMLRLKYSFD